VNAFFGEVGLCAARVFANSRFGGCAGMAGSILHARGLAVDGPRETDRFVPSPKLGLDFRWPGRGALALRVDVTGRVALARPAFLVIDDGAIHRPSLLAGQVAAGPEVRF
jgi:hypothetical protein